MSADQIADQVKQVERDLAEVAAQRDAGELDDATAELEAGHPLAEPEILFRKLDASELFGTD